MQEKIKKRVIDESNYIISTKKTIREISKYFNISKSTVHNDLHKKLKCINYKMYIEVQDILNYHSIIKHVRGGNSTRLKYLNK